MGEAEGQVESHVIGIVESGEDTEVGYVPGVYGETGQGPWFEGGRRPRGGRCLGSRSGGRVCVEVEGADDD